MLKIVAEVASSDHEWTMRAVNASDVQNADTSRAPSAAR